MNYLIVIILYRLARTLKTPPYTDAELSQRQVVAAEGFQAVIDQVLSIGFEVANSIFSTLGPRSALGEDALETYNRTYNLLRSISHALSPLVWGDKYMKDGVDPFQALTVHATAIPRWIVEAKPTMNLANTVRRAPLSRKAMKLYWDQNRKTAHTEALNSHI